MGGFLASREREREREGKGLVQRQGWHTVGFEGQVGHETLAPFLAPRGILTLAGALR